MNVNIYIVATASIFNLIFPIFGFFVNSLLYLTLSDIGRKFQKVILFNISLSLSFVGFLYMRLDQSGDVYRYGLSLDYYKESFNYGRVLPWESLYEMFYPTWYALFFVVSKLDLSMQVINAIAGFTIYCAYFKLILKSDEYTLDLSANKFVFIKCFLLISFVSVFSGYKTLWCFALISIGIIKLESRNRIGWLFFLIGMGLHPVSWFPISAYLISKWIKFRIVYLYICFLVGLTISQAPFLFDFLLNVPFVGDKVHTYINGDWANYRFQDNGEYIKFYILIVFLVFCFFCISFKYHQTRKAAYTFFSSYNNFVFIYLSLAVLFIGFRTVSTRLILDGSIFFIPYFIQVLAARRIYRKTLISFFLLLLWLILFDIRSFNFSNSSFIIGSGFPYNLFSSPFYYVV
ncbi:EpsG family protein [Shewanella oncorhynchi]|uniref:EpsG family protein n=1 Tax=Shewanella oncorhynchi TaxID=2726434 RepID=UPI003D7BBCA1